MLVIDFLKSHSLEQLKQQYNINSRWDVNHTKVSLNYDQIYSIRGDPLVEECRGLILRPLDANLATSQGCDYVIVARPMKRFYNIEEQCASKIDINHCKKFEKLDGTNTILYYDDLFQRWCVGTRSVPDADVEISEINKTFCDLFWEAVKTSVDVKTEQWINELDKNTTYIFELTSPFNNIVVEYDNLCITLLAIIDRESGIEHDIESINIHCKIPQKFDLCNNIKDFVNCHEGSKFEGCVLVDDNFNRVKIKNENYILLSHHKNSLFLSDRNIIKGMFNGTIDDVLQMFSINVQNIINEKTRKIFLCLQNQQSMIESIEKSSKNDKEFALEINSNTNIIKFMAFMIHHKKADNVFDFLTKLSKNNKLTNQICDSILEKCC